MLPSSGGDLGSQRASKHDTSPAHAIVALCRLPRSTMLPRLRSGIRFSSRKHEEIHNEKHRYIP